MKSYSIFGGWRFRDFLCWALGHDGFWTRSNHGPFNGVEFRLSCASCSRTLGGFRVSDTQMAQAHDSMLISQKMQILERKIRWRR